MTTGATWPLWSRPGATSMVPTERRHCHDDGRAGWHHTLRVRRRGQHHVGDRPPGRGDQVRVRRRQPADERDRRQRARHAWGYDAANRVTSLADQAGLRLQTYDPAGRLVKVSRGAQTFSYGYDADGNVTSRVWPDSTKVTAAFDAADRMTGLTAQVGVAGSAAASYAFGYDLSGRVTTTTYPASTGLVTDRTYDAAGRLVDVSSHDGSGTVARYQLTRDPVGNPTAITTTRWAESKG